MEIGKNNGEQRKEVNKKVKPLQFLQNLTLGKVLDLDY